MMQNVSLFQLLYSMLLDVDLFTNLSNIEINETQYEALSNPYKLAIMIGNIHH